MTIHLCLSLARDWDGVETVRQAVALCVQATYESRELRDCISMVSAELLENAVKYGTAGTTIRYSLEDRDDGVTVIVTNGVEPSSLHAAAVKERIAWIETYDDPRSAYAAALLRAYEEQSDGGLGLVRVAHEGRCAIACDASVEGEITVSARYARPRRTRTTAELRAS